MKYDSSDYQLLDFGRGRKLERFGPLVVDRPAPTAEGQNPCNFSLWRTADGRFERTSNHHGKWAFRTELPANWLTRFHGFCLELRFTESSQIGIFPEQIANWGWIRSVLAAKQNSVPQVPLRVLNLFAYTGGATLAAAMAGAEVTHVDAAKVSVNWARRNAELSALADAPIRWIVDDAIKFCQREVRRGRQYDAILLDPPSYGHGAKGESWKLESDLPSLLSLCSELLSDTPTFILLSAHTPGVDAHALRRALESSLASRSNFKFTATPMSLSCDERLLPAGDMVCGEFISN